MLEQECLYFYVIVVFVEDLYVGTKREVNVDVGINGIKRMRMKGLMLVLSRHMDTSK